ncbi:MAG TPA: hypothetical protein VFH95_03385 [Candidatus Kapabacteria bacterium]|nr:hypothetical protein [Candidatus Kapabacteria bacterium]
MTRPVLFLLLLFVTVPCVSSAQSTRTPKHTTRTRAAAKARTTENIAEEKPLEIFGIRPGITFDSVKNIMAAASTTLREVREDTISHSYTDNPAHVYVVDSIICRLTYMRMAFVFDGSNRLRRLTITPRESSIAVGATDDIENVLLLYFGQEWGKPELDLSPPLPVFRWRTGNIELRGFIRRGYPMWVLEG